MERFQKARTALSHATDANQVARVVRDCVVGLPSDWTSRLPTTTQEILRNPDADIAGAAMDILRAEMRAPPGHETIALLHELAQTYAAAATRLAQLTPQRKGK